MGNGIATDQRRKHNSGTSQMENFPLRKEDQTIQVEGLPDARFIVELDDPISKQIAHLALHKHDLDFVLICLEEINKTNSDVVREALWQSAIIRFIKCFDSGTARIRLSDAVIYPTFLAKENFSYFKKLRNKTIVHDENAYTQCIPGAAINDGTKAFKVEKILALSVEGGILDQNNYNNLHLLATDARKWVIEKFDKLCEMATGELEKQPHDALAARKRVTVSAPTLDQLGIRRTAP